MLCLIIAAHPLEKQAIIRCFVRPSLKAAPVYTYCQTLNIHYIITVYCYSLENSNDI